MLGQTRVDEDEEGIIEDIIPYLWEKWSWWVRNKAGGDISKYLSSTTGIRLLE